MGYRRNVTLADDVVEPQAALDLDLKVSPAVAVNVTLEQSVIEAQLPINA